MPNEVKTESTELAVVNAQNAVQIFTGGGLSAILDGIEGKVRGMELDGSTVAGRDEIRSVAYKVARTKTALDAEARKLTEGWRTATSQVNSERKRAQERLDSLAEEVRKPLTEFEDKEKNRIAAHEAALSEMAVLSLTGRNASVDELQTALGLLDNLHVDRDWQEFDSRAKRVRAEISSDLNMRRAVRRKLDADQAELERLRKEEVERQIREREVRAAEAARIEAERKAKETADAEARRVIEAAEKEQARIKAAADRVRADHERAQREAAETLHREQVARELAERRAQQAEADRIEAAGQATLAKQRAEEKAAADLKAANEKAKRDSEAAITRERERVERQRKDAEAAQAKREADERHRSQIRAEIQSDIENTAPHLLVDAIMNGKIRHIKVIY